jgi:hypothetical protein
LIPTIVAVAAALDLHDPLTVQSDFFILPNPLSVRKYPMQKISLYK